MIKSFYFLIALIAIYFLAFVLQSHLFLNWDVSWLMHVTRQMLAGGRYGTDFFEINPPMILYLYTPPVLLNQFFHLDMTTALRLSIFSLATFSLWISFCLMRSKQLVLLLAILFLILPIYEFGQREHLLIILITPYLFLTASRLQNRKISVYTSLLIGLLAGLGFSIKPYFLMVFVLVELYYLLKIGRIISGIRIESVVIIFVVLTYFLCIVFFQREYLFTVIPQTLSLYHSGFRLNWSTTLLHPGLFFCVFVLLFYFTQYKNNPNNILCSILSLTIVGLLFSYLIQRAIWYYHLYPAIAISILLLTLVFSTFMKNTASSRRDYFFMLAMGIFIFMFPIYYATTLYINKIKLDHQLNNLIVFINQHAKQQSVYFFTSTTVYEFPIVEMAHAIHVSRFAFFAWLPGLLINPDAHLEKNFFIEMVAQELAEKKPRFVFVDVREQKSSIDQKFDYLPYFLSNKNFRASWSSYHYWMTIENFPLYKFQVYTCA